MERAKKDPEEEIQELKKIEQAAKDELREAPEGSLRIAKNNNTDQYYWRIDPKDTKGKYIRKSEEKLIKSLAQKDYAKKILAVLTPTLSKKKEFLDFQAMDIRGELQAVYEKFSPARKKLITSYLDTEEEFIKKWEYEKNLKKEQVGKVGKFAEISTEIYTEKGEAVRSKSEKILADKFYMLNIPYVYEVPLYVNDYGYVKPDFTVLNRRTRREFYWEHLGMMDDSNYCENAIKKIEAFEKNEILPGRNLILTYEAKEHPLNMKIVELMIREYLI